MLVAKICMIRVPHVRSARPPERPELHKVPPSDVPDDTYKRQRHYVFRAVAAQGWAEMLVTKCCMIRVPHVL
jgi:hypothetical protein